MKKPVSYYIYELLFIHDCVIVPDFGGFVANKKPAQLNKTTGSLTPPSKQILFNRNLKTNDGLLITHIVNQEKISQEKAKDYVKLFSNESNQKLTVSKVLRMDKVGLFTLGKEENIIFIQDESENYSLESFGLKPTYNKPIKRETEALNQVSESVKKIRETNTTSKLLLKAAAVILPLITIAYLSTSQKQNIDELYTQMASLNPFTAKEKTQKKNITTEKNIIEKNTTNNIEEVIEVEKVIDPSKNDLIINTNQSYYIIAGAFAERKNAVKMRDKLLSWNYNPKILEDSKLIRVSYNTFDNREDALLALNTIRQDNADAWLLTK